MDPLLVIVIALLAAGFAGELLSCCKVPRVVGQITAGMILGLPFIQSFLFDQTSLMLLDHLANIGVILLLFFTGLEINFRLFWQNLKVASGISFWNTTIPLVIGFGVSQLFGFSLTVSLIIGVCLSVTATALALDLLEEFRMLKTKLGNLIVSAGAVDDVYELGLITIVIALIEAVGAKEAISKLFINAVLFVVAVYIFRRAIIPFILRFVEKETSVTLLMSGLIITLLMAGLSNYLGFGVHIGALIAGVLFRQALLSDVAHHRPWEAHNLSQSIHTIAFGFLVPMFFFKVGLDTDLVLIWQNLTFGLVITVIAVFGTVVGSAIGYYISKRNWHNGFLLGWAMNAKGDTELVIANLALQSGVISHALFSNLIFMAVISTLISPLVFRRLLKKEI